MADDSGTIWQRCCLIKAHVENVFFTYNLKNKNLC